MAMTASRRAAKSAFMLSTGVAVLAVACREGAPSVERHCAVVRSEEGAPVPFVSIGQGAEMMYADVQGRFCVAPGRITLEAAGYVTETLTFSAVEAVALRRRPNTVVTGAVLAEGMPVGGASVQPQYVVAGRRVGTLTGIRTDERGRFLVPNNGVAVDALMVHHPHHGTALVSVTNPEVRVDLTSRGDVIVSVVAQDTGEPIPGALVAVIPDLRFLHDAPESLSRNIVSVAGPDGRFQSPTSFVGKAAAYAFAPGFRIGRAGGFSINEGSEPSVVPSVVRVALVRAALVSGIVTGVDDDQPIVGAHVEWELHGAALPISTSATTATDGRFTLHAPYARIMGLRVGAHGYRDLLLGGINGGQRQDIKGQLSSAHADREAQIEFYGIGVTVEPDPASGACVVVAAKGESTGLLVGDKVAAVDDEPVVRGLNCLDLIRGSSASDVKLTVLRGSNTTIVVARRSRLSVQRRS